MKRVKQICLIIDINDIAYNQMFNNMNFLYDPLSSIRRPRRPNLVSQQQLVNRIMNFNNNYYEDTQLQNAIMASLADSNPENNEDREEEEEEEENEETEEEMFEAMMEEVMASFDDDDIEF